MRKVLVTWLLILSACTANAQVRPVISSLESCIGGADLVCFGKVARVHDERQVAGQQYTEFVIEVEPSDVLKGSSTGTLTIQEYTSEAYRQYRGYAEAGDELIWFVHTKTDDGHVYARAFDVDKPFALPAMDYKVFTEKEALRQRIIEFVKDCPGKYKDVSLMVCSPEGVVRPRRSVVDFLIPNCPAIEPLLKRFITSPRSFLPPLNLGEDSKEVRERAQSCYESLLRREAIFELAQYPSKENVALIKKYLDDQSTVVGLYSMENRVLWYWVRDAASEVLTHWKVDFKKPQTEAPCKAGADVTGLFTMAIRTHYWPTRD